jgi:hypothetical protein
MRTDVYNRKYFAKKATQARDKLRELGGVPSTPSPQMGGIMASSPELMQAAAMRRPVVLPTTQAPVAPTPAPQPVSQMLPPSQPIPNIAGIPQGPAPTAPAPRPMAQKPGVKKLAEGGDTFLDHYKSPALKKALGKDFKATAEFGQKAITSAKAEDLGLPQELTDQMEVRREEIVNQPEVAAQNNINANVPTNQRTGDLQKDLVKAATNIGLERVPAEAEIDELNKAIAGAQLGAALAGSYVNPNTGQELRPTAGARIASAAAQGLALARDTETRRAEQEAALAKARIAARSKTKAPEKFLDSELGKTMLKFADTLAAKADYNSEQMRDNMTQAFGPEAVQAYDAAIAAQVGGVVAPSQTVETVETTETVETVFNPTAKLKDGTPIMKQGNKWVDAEGNDRTNG